METSLHLPPNTPEYEGMQQLEEAVRPHDGYVVIANIFPHTIHANEEAFPGHIDYFPRLHKLILKLPNEPHETAAEEFAFAPILLVERMGVRRRIASRGATRTDTPDGKKEADRSWAPAYRPGESYRKWPTAVLEVGYSETSAKLEQDMAWWLNGSAGQVHQGLTIDIQRGSKNIHISSWAPACPYVTPRTGRNGRVSAQPKESLLPPRRLQRVKIIPGQPPRVEGGDLVVYFKSLLLENPGAGEGDFILPRDELLDIAEPVWAAMTAAEIARG